jgi:soluble lytic murein transglycosylase
MTSEDVIKGTTSIDKDFSSLHEAAKNSIDLEGLSPDEKKANVARAGIALLRKSEGMDLGEAALELTKVDTKIPASSVTSQLRKGYETKAVFPGQKEEAEKILTGFETDAAKYNPPRVVKETTTIENLVSAKNALGKLDDSEAVKKATAAIDDIITKTGKLGEDAIKKSDKVKEVTKAKVDVKDGEFATKARDFFDSGTKDVESATKFMEAVKNSSDPEKVKTIARIRFLTKALESKNIVTFGEKLENNREVAKLLFEDNIEFYDELTKLAKKGDNSVLGAAIGSNMGASANWVVRASAPTLAAALGFGVTANPVVAVGIFTSTLYGFNQLAKRNKFVAGMVMESLKDPEKAKILFSRTKSKNEILGSFTRLMAQTIGNKDWEPTKEEIVREINKDTEPEEEKEQKEKMERTPQITSLIEKEAKKAGVPKEIAEALVQFESSNNPQVLSPKGAIGLTQLMPSTAKEWARKIGMHGKIDLRDPQTNLKIGLAYLKNRYEVRGDWRLALADYNHGLGNMAERIKESGSKDWKVLSKNPKLPKETLNYVNKFSAVLDGKTMKG